MVVFAYFVEECPLKAECSKNAWRKAKVCSNVGAKDCREMLYQHLKNCSLHWQEGRTEKELKDIVNNANVIREEFEEAEGEEAVAVPSRPAQEDIPRLRTPSRKRSRDRGASSSSRSHRLRDDDMKAVCGGVVEVLAPQLETMMERVAAKHFRADTGGRRRGDDSDRGGGDGGRGGGDGGRGSSASAAGAAAPPLAAAAGASALQVFEPGQQQAQFVRLRRADALALKDSLERTKRAVSQVAGYFRAGAAAFEEEHNRISESLTAVNNALAQADYFSG